MHNCIAISTFVLGIGLIAGCGSDTGSSLEASGTLEGTDVTISSEVAGKVLALWVDEGSAVSKGDTLLVIDDVDYRIQLRQAEAGAVAAEAQYRLAQEGSRKEDILQAEANFKTAEADYQRMKDLLASHTVAQKQYDDAYARYVTAQQVLEKATRGLRSVEIDAARARHDQAVALADQVRKKVKDCIVTAPSHGTITLRSAEPGELVGVGAQLFRLTSLKKLTLMIYVNETVLGNVHIGQRSDVSIDSAPDKTFDGTVVFISPNAEFTPKNVQTKEERTKLVFGVKIEVENPGGELKPGLPADAHINFNTDSKN